MSRKDGDTSPESASETVEGRIEFEQGSCRIYYEPTQHHWGIRKGTKLAFDAPGKQFVIGGDGKDVMDHQGRRQVEDITLETVVGFVRENVAGWCIQCGHIPQWQLMHEARATLKNVREWLGD